MNIYVVNVISVVNIGQRRDYFIINLCYFIIVEIMNSIISARKDYCNKLKYILYKYCT